MVVVSAVAFAAALLSFYFGARALRTRRAIEHLTRRAGRGRSDALARLGPADDPDRIPESDAAERRRDDVSIERGFVLLALGAVCALLGVLAL
ncbi:hypothetical protein [Halobellus rubicundus]|uniref:Uncharacterized protein n=1 Tax=Halobellus rubicundus TaxID=2996466 RepID=A0ABD5M751_9EURY